MNDFEFIFMTRSFPGLSAQYGEPSHNFVNLFDLPPSQSYGNFNVHFLYSLRWLKTISLTTQESFMALYVLFIPLG